MVCQACQRILEDKTFTLSLAASNPGHRLFYHHLYPYLIELAAQGGCQICKILWDGLSDAEKELARQTKQHFLVFRPLDSVREVLGNSETRFFYGWTKVQAYNFKCHIRFQFGSLGSKIVDIFFLPAKHTYEVNILGKTVKSPTMEELVSDTFVTDHMDSAANWDLMQSWINSCSPTNDSHCICHNQNSVANADVPSRLIDLEAGDTHKAIRLSLSPGERAPLPYVTLSYTWGPNPAHELLPLLRKNALGSFAKEIPYGTLPRLFQDAINVVRRLKFRYLWIDAFCIIQDDERDWQRESAVMGDIYRNATLNIAAGGAINSHSSLFTERDPSLVRLCRVELDWPKNDVRGSFFAVGSDFLRANVLQTPLNHRAWVLQERMLSKRILHFGKHQLFWKCCIDTACETFPKEISRHLDIDTPFFTSLGGWDLDRFKYSLTRKDVWFEIVETYSNCQLTKESDKLIALSGIARMVSERSRENDDLYLAGIWRSKLIPSLLWLVVNGKAADGSPCQRTPAYGSADYVAPSWSWASVRGKIVYKLRDDLDCSKYSCLVDILETHILPKDIQNLYGQVRACYIRLQGTLVSSLDFIWTRYYVLNEKSEKNYNVLFAFTGLFRNAVACIIDDMKDCTPPKTFLSNLGFLSPPDFALLPLISRLNQENVDDRKLWQIPDLEGLLVARASGKGNKYRRVGYFKSVSHGKHLSAFLGLKRSEIVLV